MTKPLVVGPTGRRPYPDFQVKSPQSLEETVTRQQRGDSPLFHRHDFPRFFFYNSFSWKVDIDLMNIHTYMCWVGSIFRRKKSRSIRSRTCAGGCSFQ